MKNNVPFTYFESHSRETFAEYVQLRRRVFLSTYPDLPEYFGLEDETDNISQIVLASAGDVIAGGARLTIATPECPRRLPMEEAGFDLRNSELFRQLALDRQPYGEISRMAVAPETGMGFQVSSALGTKLCALAGQQNVDVLFSICPDGPARINQRNARMCGVDFERLPKLPTVFGIDMWLCVFTGIRRMYGPSPDNNILGRCAL